MNRKKRRCPYCGKGMSYFSAYSCRRKAEYVCGKCGKESKVVISKLIIPIFIIAAVISLAVMGFWFFFQLLSNPLGILLVAAPLIIFMAFSPQFVQLEPLKKYRKSMEAKKAGIEYSDNLTALDFEDDAAAQDSNGQFKINSDLFQEIKSSRKSPNKEQNSKELISHSEPVAVPSEASDGTSGTTTNYSLKKLRSEKNKSERHRHYIDDSPEAQQQRAAKQAAEQAKAAAKQAAEQEKAAARQAAEKEKAAARQAAEQEKAAARAARQEAKEAKREAKAVRDAKKGKRIQTDKPVKNGSRYTSDRRF